MCDPVSAVIGAIAVVGGAAAINADQQRRGDAATDAINRGAAARAEDQAKREAIRANENASKPKRADAAEALYGNPMRAGSSGGEGGASTGITTQVSAAPTALTLGKNDLLGQ